MGSFSEQVWGVSDEHRQYQSNLVMYDRATRSLWPQALGQAVTGPLTGQRLQPVPTQIVSWAAFRTSFPDGLVLSRDTGFSRPYGRNPYVGYDAKGSTPFLFDGKVDPRLGAFRTELHACLPAAPMRCSSWATRCCAPRGSPHCRT